MTEPQPTARQRLTDAMRARTCFCGADSCHNAEQLVDALVHELAEQQRAHLRNEGYELDCVCGSCTACLAREYIDLIDPKAQP